MFRKISGLDVNELKVNGHLAVLTRKGKLNQAFARVKKLLISTVLQGRGL
jgi:hypothetical protein